MACCYTLLNIAVVAILAGSSAFAAPVVTLHPEAEVRSTQSVKVKDIADIQASDTVADRLGEIVLTTAPLPGQRRTLDTNYVRLKLKAAAPDDKIEVKGPEKIALVGECVRVSSDELTNAAREFVLTQLPTSSGAYDVVVQRSPRELALKSGNSVDIRPRLYGNGVKLGPNTVALDIVVDGHVVATTSTALQVNAIADVLVATAAIAQGEAITSQNTTWEQREITKVTDPVIITESGELRDWVARRSIRAGGVIRSTDITLPPTIRSGETVTLVVNCGSVTLRTTAEARQDARIGETIKVRSSVSDQDVRGRVSGPGMVEINR